MSKWPGVPELQPDQIPKYNFKQSLDEMQAEMIQKEIDRQLASTNAPRCLREWFSEPIDLQTESGLYKNGYCWGYLHGDSTPNIYWINERMWMLGFVDGKGDSGQS